MARKNRRLEGGAKELMKFYRDAGLKAVIKTTKESFVLASFENDLLEYLPPVVFFQVTDLEKYPRQGLTEISEQEFEMELKRVEEKLKAKEELKQLQNAHKL